MKYCTGQQDLNLFQDVWKEESQVCLQEEAPQGLLWIPKGQGSPFYFFPSLCCFNSSSNSCPVTSYSTCSNPSSNSCPDTSYSTCSNLSYYYSKLCFYFHSTCSCSCPHTVQEEDSSGQGCCFSIRPIICTRDTGQHGRLPSYQDEVPDAGC